MCAFSCPLIKSYASKAMVLDQIEEWFILFYKTIQDFKRSSQVTVMS